jgi:hypothetical protein
MKCKKERNAQRVLVREDFERRISLLKTLAREDNIQRDLNEI